MAILDRGEDNARRKDRLKKLKKGPGTFVYVGGASDTAAIPTYLRMGARVPRLDAANMPITDGSGRQVYERAGAIVKDMKGQPVLGGPPKVEHIELETYDVRGVSFPKDEPVQVKDPTLALKLRCLSHFEEVDEDGEESDSEERGEKPDEMKSRPQLMKLAKSLGLQVRVTMKREELLALIGDARSADEQKADEA